MKLELEPYPDQLPQWPRAGRHILAHYDADSIVVYQAYNRAIGEWSAANGRLGGGFSYTRMSWIKPNFLWMMFRSGWGVKPNQEVTLALRIRRAFFDEILALAVASSWDAARFATEDDWKIALSSSSVRLQWDPDHLPSGAPCERRAIQLGLRGDVLIAFGQQELLDVIDLSDFVAEQRETLAARGGGSIVTPRERVYRPSDPAIAARLGLDG